MSLVSGMAELLAANGIGEWQTESAYAKGALGIYDSVDPHGVDAITLTEYPVSDAGGDLADSVRGIQIRVKQTGPVTRVRDTGEQLFNLLHSRAGFHLGSQYVIRCERHSAAYLGQQDDGHMEAHNFYLDLVIPTPNRTE